MSEQPVLDVLRLERFFQQRIVLQIDHAQAQVIAGPPVGIGLAQFLGAERRSWHRGSGLAVGAQGAVFRRLRCGWRGLFLDFHRFGWPFCFSFISKSQSRAVLDNPAEDQVQPVIVLQIRARAQHHHGARPGTVRSTGTGGAACHSTISCGGSSAVSIHRRHAFHRRQYGQLEVERLPICVQDEVQSTVPASAAPH